MNEQLFEVRGEDGLARRGILTMPAEGRGTTAVLLLPAGLKYRIGPHRLNVKLARRLAASGYLVLRFDPLGLGESDGAIAPGPMREIWRTVESGRFVDDVLLAATTLRARHGVERLLVGGLCGGAITAQLAAARVPGAIDGVVSFGTAVTLSGGEGAAVRPVSTGIARHHFQSYLQKLLSRDAWARLLGGESDFASISATLRGVLRGLWRKRSAGAGVTPFPNENPAFIESFHALERRQMPHLLVFGDGDNRWLEFNEAILRRYLKGARQGAGYEIELIPQANHELHWTPWQETAIAAVAAWLQRRFPLTLASRNG